MANVDKKRFSEACNKILNNEHIRDGIGTLGEKTLHAILKGYYEPCSERQEIKIGKFFADIVNDDGIVEIQTQSFNLLRKKLDVFLEQSTVTIVYPIASTKWLIWIDEDTGELSKKRKSPKKGKSYEIFSELYKIKPRLLHPNLKFCIVLLDIEEYRSLNGWSDDKKKGSSRFDRIPIDIVEEVHINNFNDYAKLIPDELPQEFTTKDLKKHTSLSPGKTQQAMNVLHSIGAVERTGKNGKLYTYKRLV